MQKLLKISSTSALGGLLLDVWGLGAGRGWGRPISTDPRAKWRCACGPGEQRLGWTAGPRLPGQVSACRQEGRDARSGSGPGAASQQMPRRCPGLAVSGGGCCPGGGGGVQRGGSLRSRGPRAPCAMGYPSIYEPFWCWGSYACLAKAVPRGCPLLMPLAEPGRWLRPKWGGGARSFPSVFLPEDGCFRGPHGVAPGSLGTGGNAGQGGTGQAAGSPGETGKETTLSPDPTRPRESARAAGSSVLRRHPPGRVPSGARGRPASSVAGHRRPWGRVPRKTFWRGGGAPSSCAWSGREWSGEGGLRATTVPGDSEALLGLPNPPPCPLAMPWGSSMIPPAGHGGPSKRRPRRWSRMGMETMDGQTDRAVDGDSAAKRLLLLGFWVSS